METDINTETAMNMFVYAVIKKIAKENKYSIKDVKTIVYEWEKIKSDKLPEFINKMTE